jgi:hypothetical protein
MTNHTTRRTILIGAAAIPAAVITGALPATADEATFDRLAAELTAAADQHGKVLDVLEIAEKAMFDWGKRNPRPELRECTIGTIAEYEAWRTDPTRVDPNADLKAAMAEQKAAMRTWNKAKVAAEARCGYTATYATEGAVCSEISELIDKLSAIPASTMHGLRTKAALATKFHDADLAWSIVDDLLGVTG